MQLFLVAILVFVLDQATKQVALRFLTFGTSTPVVAHIFHLTLVENQGIAFGVLQDHAPVLLIVITLCVLILIAYFVFVPQSTLYQRFCYGFILGGALGNLVDRLRLGHVVDFLDFRIWPVFNVADAFISIGVGLLILTAFKKSSRAS